MKKRRQAALHHEWNRKIERPLCGLPMFGVAKTGQKLGGLVGRTRSGEDRFAVGFEDAKPVADIFGMIGARLGGDTKIAAEERRAKLGNHLFHRIGIIAKAFTERARAT